MCAYMNEHLRDVSLSSLACFTVVLFMFLWLKVFSNMQTLFLFLRKGSVESNRGREL